MSSVDFAAGHLARPDAPQSVGSGDDAVIRGNDARDADHVECGDARGPPRTLEPRDLLEVPADAPGADIAVATRLSASRYFSPRWVVSALHGP